MRTAIVPVDQTGLCVLNPVAIAGKRSVRRPLFHDQLHVLDTAVKVRVEVSRKCGVGYLVLLVCLVFDVGDVYRVSEYALRGEELIDEAVPVGQVVFALGALDFLSVSCDWVLSLVSTYGKAAQMFAKLHQLQ